MKHLSIMIVTLLITANQLNGMSNLAQRVGQRLLTLRGLPQETITAAKISSSNAISRLLSSSGRAQKLFAGNGTLKDRVQEQLKVLPRTPHIIAGLGIAGSIKLAAERKLLHQVHAHENADDGENQTEEIHPQTVRITAKCKNDIDFLQEDMGKFYYFMEGVFNAVAEKTELTPTQLFTQFVEEPDRFSALINNFQRTYLFPGDCLVLLADCQDVLEATFNETLAATNNRQQAWNAVTKQLKKYLQERATTYVQAMINVSSAEVELADRGIRLHDKTMTIDLGKLRGDEAPLLERVFGPAPAKDTTEQD